MTAGCFGRRLGLAAFIAPCALGSIACGVGVGSGTAVGTLWAEDCHDPNDYGSQDMQAPYSLDPKFFAGEPIDDVRPGAKDNNLWVRMQRSGGPIETTDTLYFSIFDSYEVARCVRGRVLMNGGQAVPDYDTTQCSWATGVARLKLTDLAHMRAYLTLFATCPHNLLTGVAISSTTTTDGNWESWVEMTDFGGAAEPQITDPTQRDPIALGFKVEFGERIRASNFHLQIQDDRVLEAVRDMNPPEAPQIQATLDGFFDFDLQRSRSAQVFP